MQAIYPILPFSAETPELITVAFNKGSSNTSFLHKVHMAMRWPGC